MNICRFPNFDWLLFFNTIFEDINEQKATKAIQFASDEPIVIYGAEVQKANIFKKYLPFSISLWLDWTNCCPSLSRGAILPIQFP
jgi:hypothetical protein